MLPKVKQLKDSCPNKARHVKREPNDYVQWHEWAEKKSKTHKQIQCKGCGLYVIWVRRK